jgi:hypothetical protein
VLAAAQAILMGRVVSSGEGSGKLAELVESVADRRLDPRSAAEELIAGGSA